jgi:hypothetical protein
VEGLISFKMGNVELFEARETRMDRELALDILTLAASFQIVSVRSDLGGYLDKIANVLQESGISEWAYYPLLGTALISRGLANYASVMGCYLDLVKDEMLDVPISQMAIWSLAEVARMQIECISINEEWPDLIPPAERVLKYAQAENLKIHGMDNPYGNIFHESYADVLGELSSLH